MKFKYAGQQDENTIRGVTFEKGKAVVVDDVSLQAKLLAHPDFEEVKTRKAKK